MVERLEVSASGFLNLKDCIKGNRVYLQQDKERYAVKEYACCDCDQWGGGEAPCDCNCNCDCDN